MLNKIMQIPLKAVFRKIHFEKHMFYKIPLITFLFVIIMSFSAFSAEKYCAKSMAEGNDVYFDCYNIGENHYISLGDIALLLKNTQEKFAVRGGGETFILEKGSYYTPTGYEFYKSTGKKKCHEKNTVMNLTCGEKQVNAQSCIINDRCYTKLSDVADVLGIDVIFDESEKLISLTSDNVPLTYISLHEPVLYDISKPMVALTFDDGPSPQTPKILNTLDKYGAAATFFVVGTNAERYKDTLKSIDESGCEIGNHTYDHCRLIMKSNDSIKNEVNRVQNTVYGVLGIYPRFLRPPYGEYNQRVKDNIALNMVNWSVDTLDWKYRNSNHIYNAVMKNVKDGSVILMHDLYGSTAEAVEKVVPELHRRGYQIVTVSQLYEAKGKLSGQIK